MSNVPNFELLSLHQEQYTVVRFHYLLKKNCNADVCSYERSVQLTDARSQYHFLLPSAVYAGVGLCITEAKSGIPMAACTEIMVNTIGKKLADDDSLSQRQIALISISQIIV